MGDVSYFLKDAKAEGRTSIYLQFKYNGKRLKYYFGQSVEPANWNKKRQRVKSNNTTTEDGKHLLNDLLDSLAKECKAAYNGELKTGVPLPATLRKRLDEFINQNEIAETKRQGKPTLFDLIDRFASGEVKGKKGKERSEGSRDNYHAAKQHLLSFQEKHNYRVDFDTITLEFFDAYTTFLKKEYTYQTGRNNNGKKITGLSHNTIAKAITYLKTFMNKAVTLGYTTNLAYKHEDFCFAEEDTDAVYLTEDELIALFRFTMPTQKLEETKDLFIFGSFTGLRFSDYSNVGPENIIKIDEEPYVKIKTQKTGEVVYVPCHPIVLRIFEKYDDRPNKLPKTISNQKFNDYIKEACKLAGLNEKGRLSDDPKKELWECISSHTARRSFATNLFIDGYQPLEIMKVTGHKTEEAFRKYIRISKLESAKKLGKHMKETWSRKQLKVAV